MIGERPLPELVWDALPELRSVALITIPRREAIWPDPAPAASPFDWLLDHLVTAEWALRDWLSAVLKVRPNTPAAPRYPVQYRKFGDTSLSRDDAGRLRNLTVRRGVAYRLDP